MDNTQVTDSSIEIQLQLNLSIAVNKGSTEIWPLYTGDRLANIEALGS